MPLINTYSANGELISSIEEPLNEHNIERFISQDEQKAKIYLEALAEFNANLKEMVYRIFPSGALVNNSPHMACKSTRNYYLHNSNVLKLADQVFEFKQKLNQDLL